MTCRSCELLIERKLRSIPGVTEVRASERRGEAEVFSKSSLPLISLASVQAALEGTPYSARSGSASTHVKERTDKTPSGLNHWFEVGGILILVIAFYQIFKGSSVFSLRPSVEGVASIGAIFAIGLTAAASTCLAVVGGLLLSVSAKWTETFHPTTRWEKFQPLLMFNLGRVGGYFVLGGLVGALGTVIGLSTRGTGFLTIFIAVVMIVLGLNILKILPKRYCTLPMPRAFRQKLHALAESKNPLTPMLLGALTFFLPCGFTQSMQLLALSSGSFVSGGVIMLVFALGTLPSLLGISVVSAVAEGRFARYFLTFSGSVVLLLGIFNLQSGLLLTGVDAQEWARSIVGTAQVQPQGNDPYVTINQKGEQIISMYVSDTGYSPDRFTIDAGKPTWVYAIAEKGVVGCANTLTIPTYNLSTTVKQGGNWLGPIVPTQDFTMTCSMGMFRATIHVRPS